MKVLVLNCGSSSIKYKLYNMDDESVLAQGGVERIGLDNAFIKVKLPNGEKKQIMHDMPDHKEGVNFVFKCLLDPEIGAIKDLKEIDAVGHRVVQGGDKFKESVIVDKSVEDGIEELCDLAPVHNAGHLKGIRAVDSLMPGTPQVCVFDNAFHSTMPDYAYLYAIPYELYEKYHVRRYGFHGTSHRYVSKRVCEILGLDQNNSKIITCHIGNGGSVAAVLNGKVLDTSMGLTPLAGLMMGSRCGDIDASAVTYLMEKLNMNLDEYNGFIIVTRAHEYDNICLEQLRGYLPTYMGVMGSQKRIHHAFEVLREQGWTQDELDMVYAPIGLDLGAQTPEEIALSIVSEYLAVVRGKKGGSLRKGRVIHES